MARRSLLFGVLIVAAFVLGACAGNGARSATVPESAADAEMVITGTDSLRFEPDTFTLPAGQQLVLALTADSIEHDFVIEDAADVGMAEAGDAAHGHGEGAPDASGNDLHVVHAGPGQTTTATFQINEPGTYAVYCSVPGHREAGMTATLTFVDGA